MSNSSISRANRIDIAGASRPWTSTPIATSAPTSARIAATTSAARRIVTEESTGSVASSGATLSAAKPASTIASRTLRVLLGRRAARPVRVEADPVAAGAAEQRVHGQPRGLSGDVPERLLDAADRGHQHRPAAPERVPIHDLPEMLDPARVLALDQARELGDGGHDRLGLSLERRLSEPGDSLVGPHLDEHPVAHAAVDDEGLDLGDLHPLTLPAVMPAMNRRVISRYSATTGRADSTTLAKIRPHSVE